MGILHQSSPLPILHTQEHESKEPSTKINKRRLLHENNIFMHKKKEKLCAKLEKIQTTWEITRNDVDNIYKPPFSQRPKGIQIKVQASKLQAY